MADGLEKAIELAGRLRHVFVATADDEGLPHVAAACRLTAAGEGRVAVEAWFCPGTVANVERNPRVALVVWDPSDDHGYQLVGSVEKMEALAVLDGYIPEAEGRAPLPQVERQLLVRVDTVLQFTHAPHSDVAE